MIFFQLIGSSLLFVHNETKAGVWLIDFAKTIPLPKSVKISHSVPWVEGTHEDGYLIGLNNLTELIGDACENPPPPPFNEEEIKPISDTIIVSEKAKDTTEDSKDTEVRNDTTLTKNAKNTTHVVDSTLVRNSVTKQNGQEISEIIVSKPAIPVKPHVVSCKET